MTDTPTTRWKLTIEYDGTNYSGWQRQKDIPSVQQAIEEAIKSFSNEDVRLHVAGRTDTGVHALGQVAHFDLVRPTDAKTVREALNAYLRHEQIAILSVEEKDESFHARFNALKRRYCYRVTCARKAPLRIDQDRSWWIKHDLDVEGMRRAAEHLIGEHDFSTFRDSECQSKTPVKTLYQLDITETENHLIPGRQLYIWVEAKSFLHHQVRNFMGTLKLVGEGKWSPDDVKTALEARDRTKGGPTAPAHGLYFISVDYD